MNIAESIIEATRILREAGVSEARREASALLEHILERDRTFVITHADTLVGEQNFETYRQNVMRRSNGEPLQYITGSQDFFGLDFEVTPAVLIPRPETELLVETALKILPVERAHIICDVGTGSGCIAIALLHERTSTRAIGIDVSTKALQVAKRNAVRHAVDDRMSLVAADIFSCLKSDRPVFDLVVSNPPYVAGSQLAGLQREVRDHEPREALTPGADGLTVIRRLLSESDAFIKSGAHLLIEIGFDQGAEVERLVDPDVWRLLAIHNDLQSIPRIVALQKTAR